MNLGNLTKSLELTNLLLDLEEDHPRAKSNKIFLDEEIRHLPASQRSGKVYKNKLTSQS